MQKSPNIIIIVRESRDRVKFEPLFEPPTCYCVVKLLVLFQLHSESMLIFLSNELVVQTFLILYKVNWIGSVSN